MTTPQQPSWYSVNNMGMATLCADKADAEDVARTCDIDFPRQSPHRAVQLVELSDINKLHVEIARLTAENEALRAKMALVDYVLQDDIHNQLTPRVVDIAYSAFMVAKTGKNKDDGGPCDWFNDTKPMVMDQLAKIQKHLVEEAAHGIGEKT